ncbi:hypothetical protein [Dyella sedimenti]|uniref:hypothetical protein n=1 Tax=Dyella sedimenti TaxID=2919947 RepID=UPI001FAB2BCC|nr:hypothetical protein [Dyella sedimenti]
MTKTLSGLVVCALALAAPVRAADAPKLAGAQAADQKRLDQAIAQQQGQVKQLQGDVEREETRSHQDDAKLKQQDQQIADLQRQLQALKAAPQGSSHP